MYNKDPTKRMANKGGGLKNNILAGKRDREDSLCKTPERGKEK